MSKELKILIVSIPVLIIVFVGAAFFVPFIRLQVLRTFGVKFESTQTDIYRENKSYVEGTVRDLREMRVEYEKASDGHKSALKSLILQRANELDWERLPNDLQVFLNEL